MLLWVSRQCSGCQSAFAVQYRISCDHCDNCCHVVLSLPLQILRQLKPKAHNALVAHCHLPFLCALVAGAAPCCCANISVFFLELIADLCLCWFLQWSPSARPGSACSSSSSQTQPVEDNDLVDDPELLSDLISCQSESLLGDVETESQFALGRNNSTARNSLGCLEQLSIPDEDRSCSIAIDPRDAGTGDPVVLRRLVITNIVAAEKEYIELLQVLVRVSKIRPLLVLHLVFCCCCHFSFPPSSISSLANFLISIPHLGGASCLITALCAAMALDCDFGYAVLIMCALQTISVFSDRCTKTTTKRRRKITRSNVQN